MSTAKTKSWLVHMYQGSYLQDAPLHIIWLQTQDATRFDEGALTSKASSLMLTSLHRLRSTSFLTPSLKLLSRATPSSPVRTGSTTAALLRLCLSYRCQHASATTVCSMLTFLTRTMSGSLQMLCMLTMSKSKMRHKRSLFDSHVCPDSQTCSTIDIKMAEVAEILTGRFFLSMPPALTLAAGH